MKTGGAMNNPQRTDTRPLEVRKASCVMRKAELRSALAAVERAEAEIDTEIEERERERERERAKAAAESEVQCEV